MVALIVALSIVVGIPVVVGSALFWFMLLALLLPQKPQLLDDGEARG